MIKHVVFWKLKDFAEGRSKEENIKTIKNGLLALKDKIPQILEIEAGKDLLGTEQSWDMALYSVFRDLSSLDIYRNHPDHQKMVEFIAKVITDRAIVDYEA